MKKASFTIALLFLIGTATMAQNYSYSYAFGIKSGMVAGLQRINGLNNREALFGYQGDIFIETADEEDKFSLFAQLGYHQRGSAAIFIGGYNPFGQNFPNERTKMLFHNASLVLGGKQKFDWNRGNLYYALGLRGEYTFDWDLGYLNHITNQEQFVRSFLYGVYFGAGVEWPFSEYTSGILELSIHPDLSRQMFLPQQLGVDRNGQNFTISEQNIFNVSVELSVGLRFLHVVEVID